MANNYGKSLRMKAQFSIPNAVIERLYDTTKGLKVQPGFSINFFLFRGKVKQEILISNNRLYDVRAVMVGSMYVPVNTVNTLAEQKMKIS